MRVIGQIGTLAVHHVVSRMFAIVQWRALTLRLRKKFPVRYSYTVCARLRNRNNGIQCFCPICNQPVGGSNPFASSNISTSYNIYFILYFTEKVH